MRTRREKIVFKRLALPVTKTHMCREPVQARVSHTTKVWTSKDKDKDKDVATVATLGR